MIRLTVLLLIAAIGTAAMAQEVSREVQVDAELSRLLEDWTKGLSPRQRALRYRHKASVVHWVTHYELDAILVGDIIKWESSWRPNVRGPGGEYGLMQLLNRDILRKYPEAKTDPDTNVRAGCELLRACLDKCGTVKAALGCYGTGKCTTKGDWLDRRYRKYVNDIERFRDSKNN